MENIFQRSQRPHFEIQQECIKETRILWDGHQLWSCPWRHSNYVTAISHGDENAQAVGWLKSCLHHSLSSCFLRSYWSWDSVWEVNSDSSSGHVNVPHWCHTPYVTHLLSETKEKTTKMICKTKLAGTWTWLITKVRLDLVKWGSQKAPWEWSLESQSLPDSLHNKTFGLLKQ